MNSIEIHTKRLVLRPLSLKYLETVHEYASDIENAKYMVRLPNENIEETRAFLLSVENEWSKEDPEFFEFAIMYNNNQIGAVSVYVENGSGELGWIINKKCWNQGFAFESALALIGFAKQKLGLTHFIANCDVENVGSYRVMEKLGMVRTGEYGGRKNKSSDDERREYRYELSCDLPKIQ